MDISENTQEIPRTEKKVWKQQLTLEKMRVALEKLQLARVRTTITLIALGFGIYKFFFARIEDGKKPLLNFPNGRDIGMFLILIGFIALLLSTAQHVKSLAKLKVQYMDMHYSVSLLLSYFVLTLSLSLFLAVLFYL